MELEAACRRHGVLLGLRRPLQGGGLQMTGTAMSKVLAMFAVPRSTSHEGGCLLQFSWAQHSQHKHRGPCSPFSLHIVDQHPFPIAAVSICRCNLQ